MTMTMKRIARTYFLDPRKPRVDQNENFREDYDLPSLMEQIRRPGKIIDPIHLLLNGATGKSEKEVIEMLKNLDTCDLLVGRGNRRTAAAQELLKDPALPADLRDALLKTEFIVYWDFSPEEKVEFMLDHGGSKPLSRVEVIKAVRRLSKQMKSETEICRMMFQSLSKLTKNERKSFEAQQIPPGVARDKFLRGWLHGTVGQWLIPGMGMGNEVFDQMILTERAKDRKLTEAEEKARTFECDRSAVTDLWKAKGADEEVGQWDAVHDTGPQFAAKLAELKSQFGKPKPEKERVSAEQLKAKASVMTTPGLKIPFLVAAGTATQEQKNELAELDAEYSRREKVLSCVLEHLDRISDDEIKALLTTICYKGDTDVLMALQPFMDKPKAKPAPGADKNNAKAKPKGKVKPKGK